MLPNSQHTNPVRGPNDIMKGLVLTLTEQDMMDIDAFYAQNKTSRASISESEVAAANRGRALYRRGSTQFSVPACMACHGPAVRNSETLPQSIRAVQGISDYLPLWNLKTERGLMKR